MRILVTGSNGFIGKHVTESLSNEHLVYAATREKSLANENSVYVDLEVRESIKSALKLTKPDAVINCSGILENNERASLNETFTANLMEEIINARRSIGRVVIMGSAAEYGIVKSQEIPVNENTPLRPTSDYGKAKAGEARQAIKFGREYDVDVVIARVFNPIGPGMNKQQLLPSLIKQIKKIQNGKSDTIEVNRLDAKRDYIDVRDVANAINILINRNPKEHIYNIGSGKSTSVQDLIDLILSELNIDKDIQTHEKSPHPEPLYAIKADINRMKNEFDWRPSYNLRDTVRSIING